MHGTVWISTLLLTLGLVLVPAQAGVQVETEVIATIDVGDGPRDIVVNPFTNRVYVATLDGMVWVIDGERVAAKIPVGPLPVNLAINPTNNRIYVGHALIGQVTVIDGNINAVIATPVTDISPSVSVNPVTNRAIASSDDGYYVSFIEEKTHDVRTRYAGYASRKPAIDPLTDRVYVPMLYDHRLRIFDGSSLMTVGAVLTPEYPAAAAVNPFTDRVYVTTFCPGGLEVIDGSTATTVTSLAITDPPCPGAFDVVVNPLTNRVYVTSSSGDLTIVDGNTNTVLANIPAWFQSPALDAPGDRVYIPSDTPGELLVIDGEIADVAERVDIECQGTMTAVNPLTNRVYATCQSDDKVVVLQAGSSSLEDVSSAAELTGRIMDLVIDLSGEDHALVSKLQAAVLKIETGEVREAVQDLLAVRGWLQTNRGFEERAISGTLTTLDQIILLMIGQY